jgi:hypothetical protein
MGISITINPEIIIVNPDRGIEGIQVGDDEILPFDEPIEEMFVIHPEESASGTCEECATYAGEIFGVGEGPMPQLHANCKCERVPVMATFNPSLMAWNVPNKELDVTMVKLDNMSDDALDALKDQDNISDKTFERIKKILKRRGGR